MIRAYRIVKANLVTTAFDGEGARIYGGRWNSFGTPLIYLASSVSLATLEILVHLDKSSLLPNFCVMSVRFPARSVSIPGTGGCPPLPENCLVVPPPTLCAHWGDDWARSRSSLAARVPSAVVPGEMNYLMNPLHPDFSEIIVGPARPLSLDPRLLALVGADD